MRGEHTVSMSSTTCVFGSSPHARGTLLTRSLGKPEKRIIPACAGNTQSDVFARPRDSDHPRMRGEHALCGTPAITSDGSSPHARGTPRGCRFDPDPIRIIPACAGNTAARRQARSPIPDHPRMRGEHAIRWQRRYRQLGSSPHARGTPVRTRVWCTQCRIIPACAGNTPRLPLRWR